MKNVLFFLLGLILMIGVSATTVSVMTVKPATPVTTVVLKEYDDEISKKILSYASKGFIVTHMASAGNSNARTVTVVMAKY